MTPDTIGLTILAARKRKKYTQPYICEILQRDYDIKLQQATLSAWENERQYPAPKNMPTVEAIWQIFFVKTSSKRKL